MREIKFRGKRIDGKEWEYGDFYQQWASSWLGEMEKRSLIHRLYIDEWNGQVNFEVIPSTVGQFTGLLDKNGKEIYEGDIVHGFANIFKATVEWCDYRASFYPFWNDDTKIYPEECEVIGNIHEVKNEHLSD